MAVRACIYKNCENYINLRDRTFNEHITLFNFPKNPERRQKWIEYGKVDSNIPPSLYYFCSDHFNKEFLSINNRRKVLLGEAVPHPYVDVDQVIEEGETEETYDGETELDFYLLETGQMVVDQEQDVHVESTTNLQDEDGNVIELINHELDEEVHDVTDDFILLKEKSKQPNESTRTVLNNLKRKFSDNNVTLTAAASQQNNFKTSPPKQAQLKQTSLLNKIKSPKLLSQKADVNSQSVGEIPDSAPLDSVDPKESEIDPDSLIDTKNVTTFIFKGEEYVQMPKEHYVKEKTELMKKLQKMENVVRAIKGQLNSLEF